MAVPFGLGAGIAVPIYNRFVDQDVEFTHFMLFAAVAYSITAFPVLCRILTELQIMDTTVGIVVLSAGVGNDIRMCSILWLRLRLIPLYSWLGSVGPQYCSCQRRQWINCPVYPSGRRWLDDHHLVSCSMGYEMAGKEDRF
jgi:hypothetical protein